MKCTNLSIVLLTFAAFLQSGAIAQAPAIPPDADGAPAALKGSPRHGEWVDIDLPGSEAKIRSYVVYPERPGKAPVVLVIHEIFGLTDWVRAVADQLAAEGFIAVAPDMLSGMGPGGGGTEAFDGDKVREAIRAISADDVAQRLNAVRTYAHALPAAAGKTGVVGYCWGGTQVWNYAIRQTELDAAVVYYGSGPAEASDYEKIACPVLGLYGQDDARVNATIENSENAMAKAEKSFVKHMYDGAGHGFLRQQSGRDGANARAAAEAWSRTIVFFRSHLE